MKISIARLRSGCNYKEPLHDVMDSFYELYKEYISKNTQHTYGVCNFGWNSDNRKYIDDIVDSDVVIIPSENEFHQHISGYVHTKQKARSDEFVAKIGQHLSNKHLVIIRSDRADNEELYRTRTFKDYSIGKFSIFDETDIPGGLHGMKYHFIKSAYNPLFEEEKIYDFIYWGCDKRKLIDNKDSGDTRHLFFQQLRKDNKIKSYLIGKYNKLEADRKIDTMYNLLCNLHQGKSTICFNWLDSTAVTSRYHEAMACDLLPFVWDNYDSNNTIIADQWQRVNSIEEFYDKMNEVDSKFESIKEYYLTNTLKPREWYYTKFEQRMNEIL